MSDLFDENKKRESKKIPSPPDMCDVHNCLNNADICITMVKDSQYGNKERAGAFSQFERMPGIKQLDSRYTFVQFIGRCSECLTKDMISSGKVVSQSQITENFERLLKIRREKINQEVVF